MKIAILGAQGSGKTQLAHDLSCRLRLVSDLTSTVADNPPLMAAVYRDLLQGDPSLYACALAQHKTYDLTLLTGLDLVRAHEPEHDARSVSREAVDAQLRAVLTRGQIAYTVVYGLGPARVDAALKAIAPWRHRQANTPAADAATANRWQWSCEKCSDAACEHQLFTGRLKIDAG